MFTKRQLQKEGRHEEQENDVSHLGHLPFVSTDNLFKDGIEFHLMLVFECIPFRMNTTQHPSRETLMFKLRYPLRD